MPTVYRVTAIWAGFQGAPGYSKFSFSDLTTEAARNAAGAAVKAYFQALTPYMLNTWTVAIQALVEDFDVATGDLTGENQMTTVPSAAAGSSAATNWVQGSGFFVGWRTSTIYLGRRVQGRTFHVPAVACFDTDGTLSAGSLTAIRAAADGLVAAVGAELCVWAKQWTKPVPPAKPVQIGGVLAPVTSSLVKDQASQLRSRRL